MKFSKTWLKNAIEQIVTVFVVTFIPIWAAAPKDINSALLAAIPTTMVTVKTIVATFIGNPDSANLVANQNVVAPPVEPPAVP